MYSGAGKNSRQGEIPLPFGAWLNVAAQRELRIVDGIEYMRQWALLVIVQTLNLSLSNTQSAYDVPS
jgi:hypothetical protein